MSIIDFLPIIVLTLLVGILAPIMGKYIVLVFKDDIHFLKPLELFIYKLASIDISQEKDAKGYLKALLLFNFIGFPFLFFLLIFQEYLPLNPRHFKGVDPALAFNISASFITNTNWQSYQPEVTLSYFSQTVGLGVQQFLSAATGLTLFVLFARGIKRNAVKTIGNPWKDIVRPILYVFLPLSLILSLLFVSQGVIENFDDYQEIETLEGSIKTLPMGPVASFEAIKQIGTNGGGFFNSNSAHPFENPNEITNFLSLFFMLLIPASLPFAYAMIIGSKKQGFVIFTTMLIMWIASVIASIYFETQNNPNLNALPLMEGKETRIGVVNTVLWSLTTTATSNGSVNGMLDSLSPLAGGLALFNIMIGELIFGGIGSGMAFMMMYVIIIVFICCLMSGRMPHYMGKKIENKEIALASFGLLVPGLLILIGGGLATLILDSSKDIFNKGPHGLTELVYSFSSASSNNGSAFSGFNATSNFLNYALGICMLLGRLAVVVPAIYLSEHFALKKVITKNPATYFFNSPFFVLILISFILIFTLLTFFPVITLGPIVEHFLMMQSETF